MTLVEFLRARLDEDEALARDLDLDRAGEMYSDGSGIAEMDGFPSYPWGALPEELPFMAGPGHPARVLAEVAAKRELISEIRYFEDRIDSEWGIGKGTGDDESALRLLAAPYSGHPDFDPAWEVT